MLYACGSNGSGQLGLGHVEDMNNWVPIDLDLCGEIQLSGGGNHTVIIELESGRAFGTQHANFVPLVHPDKVNWKLVSCGWDFAYLVDANNQVWFWRPAPQQDQIGAEPGSHETQKRNKLDTADSSSDPSAVLTPVFSFDSAIVQIKSGMRHTVVSLADGKVFGWGANRKGQCGGCGTDWFDKPNLFPFSNSPEASNNCPAPSVACGRDYTVVLHGSQLHYFGPSKFPDLQSVTPKLPLESGWSHILLGGRMHGSNFHNQLDMPNNFDLVTLGSEHGICAAGKTVKTWGWGEHGNCPPPHKFNFKISQIFGGCATSFVYLDPSSVIE